jgi:SAM-dependent methyltransferase
MRPLSWCLLVLTLSAASPSAAGQQAGAGRQSGALRPPDVIYVPTPREVVAKMLAIASVGPGDVVYDLGSGDGRIVISAVHDFGATRGIGIDIDPQRIKEANENARAAGVADRVRFLNQDLFEANFSDATVVALYLIPSLNAKLRPKLLALKPGTRIVSHDFDLGGDWKPREAVTIGGSRVYFWTVPKR